MPRYISFAQCILYRSHFFLFEPATIFEVSFLTGFFRNSQRIQRRSWWRLCDHQATSTCDCACEESLRRFHQESAAISASRDSETVTSAMEKGRQLTHFQTRRQANIHKSNSSRGSTFNVYSCILLFCLLAAEGVSGQRLLLLEAQPEGAIEREPLIVQPSLKLMENRNQESTSNDMISVETLPSSTILGTTNVQMVSGRANFTDLILMEKGVFTLRFTVNGGSPRVDSVPLYVQVGREKCIQRRFWLEIIVRCLNMLHVFLLLQIGLGALVCITQEICEFHDHVKERGLKRVVARLVSAFTMCATRTARSC